MNVKLKCVKHYSGMSEETECFQADVWVGNKKVAYAENKGIGGCTDIKPYENMRTELRNLEDHFLTLPKIQYKDISFAHDLEWEVGQLLEAFLDKKVLSQNSRKGLFYENKDGDKSIIGWNWKFTKMLNEPRMHGLIKAKKLQLESEGCTILNNNLGSL